MPRARRYRICAAACALAASPLVRGAVELDARISAAVSYTDNVTLAAANAQSDMVYEITPSIDLAQTSARLDTSLSYRLQAFYYRDRSDTQAYHSFNLSSQLALDPDRFFLGFGASRSQVIRDPSGFIAFGNLPISANRTDRDDFYFGPSFAYPFAGNATARGSFRRTWTRYDDVSPLLGASSVRDFESDTFQVSFDNYRKQQGFSWAARFNQQQTDYDLFFPWEHRQASVEVGVWAGNGLRMFVIGGKESAWDRPFDASLEDDFWEAGISKQAGERFFLEFASGERTYGSSSRASLSMTFENGRTALSYSELPTTSGRDPPDARLGDELDDFLDRAGAVERYIAERLSWSLSFAMRRTDLSLNVFDEKRALRQRLDGLFLPDERQVGVGLSATLDLGVRTKITASARRASREFFVDDQRVHTAFGVGASYELGTRTEVSADLLRSEEEPRGGSAASGYDANLLTLRVTRTLKGAE